MERMKNMGLKKSFVLLSVMGVVISLLLIGVVFMICKAITDQYPSGGMSITAEGIVRKLESPTREQERVMNILGWIELFACILIPVGCLGIASLLFYQLKLKKPISVLQSGTERIREHDLAFTIPEISGDELGQVCAAFETMRAEMVRTNQELWRQAEERKRLNAAFSHDLRNPVTVLKGTVKLLRQGTADERALERLEAYVLRLERYVEAMSSIQRLEQLPVQRKEVKLMQLRDEVGETARLLAPGVKVIVTVDGAETGGTEHSVLWNNERALLDEGVIETDLMCLESGLVCMKKNVLVDHGLFLTVAENLIGNAARYAGSRIDINVSVTKDSLILAVKDDGCGYPAKLIQEGPKPFGKMEEDAAHFGMGLYICQMLCAKHGGALLLENAVNGGASATAIFCNN